MQLSVAVALPLPVILVSAEHSIVLLPGQVITGTVRSRTIIVWLHVAVFPQASVAFHLRVMVYVLGHVTAEIVLV